VYVQTFIPDVSLIDAAAVEDQPDRVGPEMRLSVQETVETASLIRKKTDHE
jgi:hypothetical protein